jgi:hypothetical protein
VGSEKLEVGMEVCSVKTWVTQMVRDEVGSGNGCLMQKVRGRRKDNHFNNKAIKLAWPRFYCAALENASFTESRKGLISCGS